MTAKQQSIKALNQLAKAIGSIERGAYQAKHKQWLAIELLAFAERNAIALVVNPPGEGVRVGGAADNLNQFPPQGNFLQSPLAKANEPSALDTANKIKDTYNYPSGKPVSKACGPSVTVGEGQETHKATVEASGGKEGAYRSYMGPVGLYGGEKRPRVTTVNYEDGSMAVYNHNQDLMVVKDFGEVVTEVRLMIDNPMGGPKGPDITDEQKIAFQQAFERTQAAISEKPMWPQEATISILGPCLNPKLYSGAILEEGGRMGRKVSVWAARRFYRAGSLVKAKLDLVQGDDARYLPV